jgi:hypothetical protein
MVEDMLWCKGYLLGGHEEQFVWYCWKYKMPVFQARISQMKCSAAVYTAVGFVVPSLG